MTTHDYRRRAALTIVAFGERTGWGIDWLIRACAELGLLPKNIDDDVLAAVAASQAGRTFTLNKLPHGWRAVKERCAQQMRIERQRGLKQSRREWRNV